MSAPEQRPEVSVPDPKPRPAWITIALSIFAIVLVLIVAAILFDNPCKPGKPVPAGAPASDDPVIHRSDP